LYLFLMYLLGCSALQNFFFAVLFDIFFLILLFFFLYPV